jgi:hypothetical protein
VSASAEGTYGIYRPKHNDVLLLRPDGETFAVPFDQVPGLIASLNVAHSVPHLANEMSGAAGKPA